MKILSVGVTRRPSHVEIEHQMMVWINDLLSDEISARTTTSTIKHNAVELHPLFVGSIPPPHDLGASARSPVRTSGMVCMVWIIGLLVTPDGYAGNARLEQLVQAVATWYMYRQLSVSNRYVMILVWCI